MTPSGIEPATFRFVAAVPQPIALQRAELQLSGLIGTASHPDMQKFRIIEFFLEKRLHWQY